MTRRAAKTYSGMYGTYERLNVHVLASNLAVIRAARTRLDPAFLRRFDRISRNARKTFYRTMLKHHKEASELFRRYKF